MRRSSVFYFRISNFDFSRCLYSAAGWMLCAALAYAPLVYGGVTEEAIATLNWMLGAAIGIWGIANCGLRIAKGERGKGRAGSEASRDFSASQFSIRNSQFAISRPLVVTCVLLLLLGWWMVLNAKAVYDSDHYIFVALTRWLPSAPGSVDQAVSAANMLRVSVLLGTILLVADLVRDQRCLLRLWWTLGLVGGSIALLGLMQKASGAPMIFWREVERPVVSFFGTFYYHGNAGAFLNLTLPVTIGLAVRAFMRPDQPLVRALWLMLAVSSIVAAFANTSRMSQALAASILLVLAVGLLPKALRAGRSRFEWGTALAGAVAILFALFAVVQASRVDRAMQRWDQTSVTTVVNRWSPARTALAAVPEADWSGFGPGTFATVFPYFTAETGTALRGQWIFLHQDYVQTLLEWGWFGSALLGSLFFGGIGVGVRSWRRAVTGRQIPDGGLRMAEAGLQWTPRQRLFLPLVLLGLGSVALHALVDFPLQIPSIQLYVAVYLGVCWGSGSWKVEIRK